MLELSPELVTVLMLGGVLFGVIRGYPFALVVGGIGVLVGLMLYGPSMTREIYYDRVFAQLSNYVLLAVPCFVFMGTMLQKSGMADGLFDALYVWFGGVRGGLAVTTIIIGTIMAACVGVIAASTTMLAVIALPSMMKRGYDKSLASGAVCAGGTLGILIPPSVMLVVYGPMAGISVGRLFFAAFLPGLLLSALYCAYVLLVCWVKPAMGPAMSPDERHVPIGARLRVLAVSLVPPIALILAVLGSIFLGIASATEASAVGALAATLLALAYGKLTRRIALDTAKSTIMLSGMILLIAGFAAGFVGIFMRAGCSSVVSSLFLATPGGKWTAFLVIMVVCFLLGMFIDWVGIVFIMVPIVTPIGVALGFDALWFGMMIVVNLQMSFMSPPFAYAIFFVKSAAPPELGVQTSDIIRGVIPYVALIAVGLIICIVFPQIILYLPSKML